MPTVTYAWTIKVFEIDGTEVCQITGAVDQTLTFVLNGIDTLAFSVYLDNENAAELRTLSRVVKVWRSVNDPDNGIVYADPDDEPCFAGIITRAEKSGSSNVLSILVQSAFWRLQSKFHINNWKLVYDYATQSLHHNWDGGNMDGEKWDVSALCWRLIDLVNHQLEGNGPNAYTSIVKPTVGPPYWTKTLTIHQGRNVRRGTWVWDEITELMGLDGSDDNITGPDLWPKYMNDGTYATMEFRTAPHRGEDLSATVSFNYCTGAVSNLDDCTETEEIVPNQNFANYVWAVGNNNFELHRKLALNFNGDYGINTVSNYMHILDSDSEDLHAKGILARQAKQELARLNKAPLIYSIIQSPNRPPYYGAQYMVGDGVMLNASKGVLQVTNLKQRVYEVTLTLSENCVERATHRIAHDFFHKVIPA